VIAAVNGIGVGIGMTMLLHVDIAFIASTARLRAPFVPLGVVPEAAGSLLMPVIMGNQRAALKLYTGDWITADEAVECGLALRAVEPDALMSETMELARRIAEMPVASLSATKRIVVEGRIDAVRAARAREDQAFAGMIGQPANMEAISAFLEKRPPDFSRL
jgi:enoyl-CoA hydratase/carnithine racemase